MTPPALPPRFAYKLGRLLLMEFFFKFPCDEKSNMWGMLEHVGYCETTTVRGISACRNSIIVWCAYTETAAECQKTTETKSVFK